MPPSTLITPAELAPHLADPTWAIFDCRHQLQDLAYGRRAFDQGHIPGARFADLGTDLAGPVRPDTGRHPLPDLGVFGRWLGAQGVGPGRQVVAYDDAGGAIAARLWWMLRYLGHEAVAVLDGGLDRWLREGHRVVQGPPVLSPTRFAPRPDPRMVASLAEVMALSRERRGVLVDARSAERHRGEVEPIDPRAGHIPGAINLPFADNLGPDGCFLPAEVLRTRFAAALGGAPAASIHACGSGVTACHNLLAMTAAGLPTGRLFVGSWSLWSKRPECPVALGAGSDPG